MVMFLAYPQYRLLGSSIPRTYQAYWYLVPLRLLGDRQGEVEDDVLCYWRNVGGRVHEGFTKYQDQALRFRNGTGARLRGSVEETSASYRLGARTQYA